MENARYDYCCIDKSKHNTVKFVEENDLSRKIRHPFFNMFQYIFNIEELSGGIYEVVKGKRIFCGELIYNQWSPLLHFSIGVLICLSGSDLFI